MAPGSLSIVSFLMIRGGILHSNDASQSDIISVLAQ